ncbi:hypothetical protein [Marinactinospora rubrisoli]|uniref:Uncharacterized protein n=1 Tax=Marinactinospora rubrisoli TaxID=2715399 RepID=A0ABW2KP64_9ACTN
MNANDACSPATRPSQYGRPHVYARDSHSWSGNCVCGRLVGDRLHTEAAPGVPVPEEMRDGAALRQTTDCDRPTGGHIAPQILRSAARAARQDADPRWRAVAEWLEYEATLWGPSAEGLGDDHAGRVARAVLVQEPLGAAYRAAVLQWAADELRAMPVPTALHGPGWYGQAWRDAADHLADLADQAAPDVDEDAERLVDLEAEVDRLRARLGVVADWAAAMLESSFAQRDALQILDAIDWRNLPRGAVDPSQYTATRREARLIRRWATSRRGRDLERRLREKLADEVVRCGQLQETVEQLRSERDDLQLVIDHLDQSAYERAAARARETAGEA